MSPDTKTSWVTNLGVQDWLYFSRLRLGNIMFKYSNCDNIIRGNLVEDGYAVRYMAPPSSLNRKLVRLRLVSDSCPNLLSRAWCPRMLSPSLIFANTSVDWSLHSAISVDGLWIMPVIVQSRSGDEESRLILATSKNTSTRHMLKLKQVMPGILNNFGNAKENA